MWDEIEVKKDNIEYLPTIDVPATNMSTVFEILNQSLHRPSEVMADRRVSASSEALSTEQHEFSSEQDIPDLEAYVSFLKTDELKAELNKHGLKQSEDKSVLINRLRAPIQSQDHGEEPIESSSNADMDECETAWTCSNDKLTIEDLSAFIEAKVKEVCRFKIENLKSEASTSYANELVISLQNENKEVQDKLQELEFHHIILKQEANSLREENKSLLTVIIQMNKFQNPNEVKSVPTASTNLHDQISESVNVQTEEQKKTQQKGKTFNERKPS